MAGQDSPNVNGGGDGAALPNLPRAKTRTAAIPAAVKCPCEERTDGKLCRKESDSMTALGKLLCKTHREMTEAKWQIKLNRLQLMVD